MVAAVHQPFAVVAVAELVLAAAVAVAVAELCTKAASLALAYEVCDVRRFVRAEEWARRPTVGASPQRRRRRPSRS